MKKYILILTILSTISLVGCGHEHTFSDATCESPKTCTECGETEGTALEHNWLEATTEKPKTCSLCGLTEGKALPSITNTERGLTEELEVPEEEEVESTSPESYNSTLEDDTVYDENVEGPNANPEAIEEATNNKNQEIIDHLNAMGIDASEYSEIELQILKDIIGDTPVNPVQDNIPVDMSDANIGSTELTDPGSFYHSYDPDLAGGRME